METAADEDLGQPVATVLLSRFMREASSTGGDLLSTFVIRYRVVMFVQRGNGVDHVPDHAFVVSKHIRWPVNWHTHHPKFVSHGAIHLHGDLEADELRAKSAGLHRILALGVPLDRRTVQVD